MTVPAPFPAAPPPKQSHTLRTVLIVVGAVLVVCCTGGVIGGVFLFKSVSKATAPAREAADTFVTDLETGNTTGAYDLLCAGTRGAFPPAAFAAGVQGQQKITSHKISGVNITSGTGGTTGVVSMKLTMQNGFTDQHAFPMRKEDGAWKVCGAPY